MSEQERSSSGLLIAGGFGCLLFLFLLGGLVYFNLRKWRSLSTSLEAVARSAEAGAGGAQVLERHTALREGEGGAIELEWLTAPDGTVRWLERRGEDGGFFSDLRASWTADGVLQLGESGAFDGDRRVRALTAAEMELLERERALLPPRGDGE